MHLDQERADAVDSAVWLIGIGVLFATGYWWPGIMFLLGIASIVQGFVEGRGWYAFQGSLWAFGIGLWAALHYSIAVLFVFLGVSVLLGAFVRPPLLAAKPYVDTSLE